MHACMKMREREIKRENEREREREREREMREREREEMRERMRERERGLILNFRTCFNQNILRLVPCMHACGPPAPAFSACSSRFLMIFWILPSFILLFFNT